MIRTQLTLLAVLASIGFANAQTAKDYVPTYGEDFGQGMNFGWIANWTDEDLARITMGTDDPRVPGIGANCIRPGLFSWLFEQYGYDVREEAFQLYGDLGATQNSVMLGFPGPIERTDEYECASERSQFYKGMYEPIWDGGANGTPYNDDNTYAAYVWKVVDIYGENIRFWSVWNEPDINESGNGWKPRTEEGNWFDNDIDPCELNMKASVQSYIRMMRITYEIVKAADPSDYVCIGGIGYPSFLDAVLRSTDMPGSGEVNELFPHYGGAYFDALDFHVYPHLEETFKEWNNDAGRFDYFRHSDQAVLAIDLKRQEFDKVLADYGYDGSRYPSKVVLCTETNLPREPFNNFAPAAKSTERMQLNFNLKSLAKAQKWGLVQWHPFQIADGKPVSEAAFEFDLMGFYQFVDYTPNIYDVKVTQTGIGYRTYGWLLRGAEYDRGTSEAVEFDEEKIEVVGYRLKNGKKGWLMWAKTLEDGNEYPSAQLQLPGSMRDGNYRVAEWDHSVTDVTEDVPETIELGGTPIFILDRSAFSEDYEQDSETSSTADTEGGKSVSVFPTLAAASVNVQLPSADHAWKLQIVDAAGALTGTAETTVPAKGGTAKVDVANLANGHYFVRASTGGDEVSIAFVKK